MTVTENKHDVPTPRSGTGMLGRSHEDTPKGQFVRMAVDYKTLGMLIMDEVYEWHTCRTIVFTDLVPPKLLQDRLFALNGEIFFKGWSETDRGRIERGHAEVPGSTWFTRIQICKGLI